MSVGEQSRRGGTALLFAAAGSHLPRRKTTPELYRKLFCRLLAPSGNFMSRYSSCAGRRATCRETRKSTPPPAVIANTLVSPALVIPSFDRTPPNNVWTKGVALWRRRENLGPAR